MHWICHPVCSLYIGAEIEDTIYHSPFKHESQVFIPLTINERCNPHHGFTGGNPSLRTALTTLDYFNLMRTHCLLDLTFFHLICPHIILLLIGFITNCSVIIICFSYNFLLLLFFNKNNDINATILAIFRYDVIPCEEL